MHGLYVKLLDVAKSDTERNIYLTFGKMIIKKF